MLSQKTKLLKCFISVFCIMALILPFMSNVILAVVTQEDETVTLQTSKKHEGGEEQTQTVLDQYETIYDQTQYAYRIKDINILKMHDSTDTSFSDAFYCLDATKYFPGEMTIDYTNRGSLYDTSNSYVKDLNLTEEKYKGLVWLTKNMYLRKQEAHYKDNLLSKAFAEKIASDEENNVVPPTTLDLVKAYLTDDDIEVIQQWAMWYYTNGESNNTYQSLGSISVSLDGQNYGSFRDIIDKDSPRQEYAEILYNYLITGYQEAPEEETYPSIIKDKTPEVQFVDGRYKIGPFKIASGTTKETYTIKLIDEAGREIDASKYQIKISGEEEFTTKKLDEIFDQEFDIYIEDAELVNGMKLVLDYSKYETKASIWSPDDDQYQPATLITREKQEIHEEQSVSVNADLALRKYIVKIGDNEITSRTPKVYTNKLITGESTTAEYRHPKNPLEVNIGDKVVYEIRVYNEHSIAGTATQIVDYLPEGLSFVPTSESTINTKYGWKVDEEDDKIVRTAYTSSYTLNPFDKETNTISSTYVQIECYVEGNVKSGNILTNVAEITADDIDDRDSEPKTIEKSDIDSQTYKGKDSNKEDLTDSNYHYEGLQDDDDFEKLIVKSKTFDLALRKFTTTINGEKPEISREPVVDVTNLVDGTKTTATYTHPKDPLEVKQGDIVIYTLRIYNEGEIDGYADEITDYIPEGLGFIVGHNVNVDNYWKLPDDTGSGEYKTVKLSDIPNAIEHVDESDFSYLSEEDLIDGDGIDVVTGKVAITSSKLKYTENAETNLLKAFDPETMETLDYKDIQVACVVLDDEEIKDNLKNIAEISKDLDADGNEINDRDSVPNSLTETQRENYTTNLQDDDDFEDLVLNKKVFDLALRKFITQIGEEAVTTRIPIVGYEEEQITYTHPKDVLTVLNGDIVTYTLRIYNEGEIDGYASEVTDYLPEHVTFLPDHEVNVTYGWKMYDASGKETTDVTKAVTIKTDYLSKESSEDRDEDNLLKAFDKTEELSEENPDYRDLKVVVKVTDEKLPDGTILTNFAEISEDTDAFGNDVTDIDSDPDNLTEEQRNNYNSSYEDDDDYEPISVKYFDLSLLKIVTQAIKTEDR